MDNGKLIVPFQMWVFHTFLMQAAVPSLAAALPAALAAALPAALAAALPAALPPLLAPLLRTSGIVSLEYLLNGILV
jgi:hypothetical protein